MKGIQLDLVCLIHMAYSCAEALEKQRLTVTEQQAALMHMCVSMCVGIHHMGKKKKTCLHSLCELLRQEMFP